jgi:hypothetical protein
LSRQPNPLAALLDAQVDAHHAGVCDDDVATLQDIGEDIARFAELLAAKLARTSDGRMVTRWLRSPGGAGYERRAAETFNAADLTAAIAEAALGELDAFPVVRTAAELRLSTGKHTRAIAIVEERKGCARRLSAHRRDLSDLRKTAMA